MRFFLILAFTATAFAEHPLGAPLPAPQRSAVSQQLLLPNAPRRAAAILRLRCDGADAYRDFRAALDRAQITALATLRQKLPLVKPGDPQIAALRKASADYKAAVATALPLVQTDHHKDKNKLAAMDRAFDAAEKAHVHLMQKLKPGSVAPIVQILDAAQWVAEIRRDQSWCDGAGTDASKLDLVAALTAEGASEEIKTLTSELEPIISLREFHRYIIAANAALRWAKIEQAEYAEILNARRVVLGLRPQLLSERLSAAAAQHSEEMMKLRYFAHESPVPQNKTHANRATNAKFEGQPYGECIFMGAPSPKDAHTAWWYSDGHRLILYTNGKTAQGGARAGSTHWTFMNGDLTKFPF